MASLGHQEVYTGLLICLVMHIASGNICCSYQQFEADTYTDEAYVFIDAARRLGVTYSYNNITAHLAYDYANNRTYANITSVQLSPLLPQPVKTHYELINDFNKNTQYMFHDNVCLKYHIDSFEPYCIPDNSVLLSRGYIGNNQTYLETYIVTHLPDPTPFRVSVDPKTCVPAFMTYTFSSAQPDSGSMNSLLMSNVTPGISKPAVFTPPQYCFTNSDTKLHQMSESARQNLASRLNVRLPPFIKI